MNILGKPYKIQYVDKINDEFQLGEINTGTGIITVLRDVTRQNQEEIILHETIHAVDEELALGLTEEQVQRLSVALYAVFRENSMQMICPGVP